MAPDAPVAADLEQNALLGSRGLDDGILKILLGVFAPDRRRSPACNLRAPEVGLSYSAQNSPRLPRTGTRQAPHRVSTLSLVLTLSTLLWRKVAGPSAPLARILPLTRRAKQQFCGLGGGTGFKARGSTPPSWIPGWSLPRLRREPGTNCEHDAAESTYVPCPFVTSPRHLGRGFLRFARGAGTAIAAVRSGLGAGAQSGLGCGILPFNGLEEQALLRR